MPLPPGSQKQHIDHPDLARPYHKNVPEETIEDIAIQADKA
jgi:hypothetical protein